MQSQTGLTLVDGLFTARLDFGAAAYSGNARWLQVAVRCPAGSGSYVPLAPRQELTAAPYALHSLSAPWSGLAGVPAGFADGVDNDTTYNAGAGLSLSEGRFSVDFGGTGSATTAARSDHRHDAAYWSLAGNGGTTPGTHFLGTSDQTTLVLKVNNTHALRIEPSSEAPNLIGGWWENYVTAGVRGATIAGGGSGEFGENRVTDNFGTVSGGVFNQAGDGAGTTTDRSNATVGGGWGNTASGTAATVGGGISNTASEYGSSVGGGSGNRASLPYSTVAGGGANRVGGNSSTVGGGYSNIVSGHYATVGGGWQITASGDESTVGGGSHNNVTDDWGIVAGGYRNQAGDDAGTPEDRPYTTVGGGRDNIASGTAAVVSGGDANTATGWRSTVPGGVGNVAAGDHSLAAGRRAKATHGGAFVWADSLDVDFASTNSNTFRVRATNGAEFVANNVGYGVIAANNGAGDGLRAMTNSSAGANWAAVYATNLGSSPALYADTSPGTYSGYFQDNIYVAGNCVGCTMVYVAYNQGADQLEPGDLVAVSGLAERELEQGQPVLAIRLSQEGMPVIGAVLGRAALVASDKEGQLLYSAEATPGVAATGEYLFVVVQGLARVKVNAGAGAIQPGMRLAVDNAGMARALKTVLVEGVTLAESAPTVGIALEAVDEEGLVWVLVNPQ